MSAIGNVYKVATGINNSWDALERIDFSEAEQLVSLCQIYTPLRCYEDIGAILSHANDNEEWDKDYVLTWPEIISQRINESFNNGFIRRDGGGRGFAINRVAFDGNETEIAVTYDLDTAETMCIVMPEHDGEHTDYSTIDSAAAIIMEFISDIEAAGGIIEKENDHDTLAGDEEWIDLASTATKAHAWLLSSGYKSTLTSHNE